MKCLVCGNELPESAKFCDSCGSRVVEQGDLGVNNVQNTNTFGNSNDNLVETNNFTNQNNLGVNTVINQESVNPVVTTNDNLVETNKFNNQTDLGVNTVINQESVNPVITTNDNLVETNNFTNQNNLGVNTVINQESVNPVVTTNDNLVETNSFNNQTDLGFNDAINQENNGFTNVNDMNTVSSVDISNNENTNSGMIMSDSQADNIGVNDIPNGMNQDINVVSSNIDSPVNTNMSSVDNEPNLNPEVNQNMYSGINPTPASIQNTQPLGSTSNINTNNNKKKSILPIILIVVIVMIAVLSIAGFLVWNFFFKTNPRQVFIKGMETFTGMVLTSENGAYDSITTNFNLSTNVSTGDESFNKVFDITNKVDLSGSFGIDYKNKLLKGNVLVNYNNEKLTDVSLYGEDSSFYLYLEGLYDKYIEIPVGTYDDLFESNTNDLETIKNSINKAFNQALKDEYLESKKETITIKDASKKVTSNILSINKENSKQFLGDLNKALSEDNEIIKLLSPMVGLPEEELKSSLASSNVGLAEGEEVVVTIYTDKNKFVGLNMTIKEAEETVSFDVFKIDEFNYNVVLTAAEQNVSVDVNIKNYSSNKTYTISSTDELYNIEVILSEEPIYNEGIEKLDVTNSINYSLLTDADTTAIQNNLMQNSVFMKIILDISNLGSADYSENGTLDGSFGAADIDSSLDTYEF